MKRGGPIRRSTPLKRKKPISPVSNKRVAENRERDRIRFDVIERSRGRCEASAVIARVDPVAASNCLGRGSEMHELKKRSRGGSITDPANIVWICRPCHEWTEAEPETALRVGLLKASWE